MSSTECSGTRTGPSGSACPPPLAAVHQPPLAGDGASVALCLLGGPASSLSASPQPTPSPSPAPHAPGLSDPEGLSQLLTGTQRHCSFQETPATAVCLTTPLGVSLPRPLLSTCTALGNPSSSLLKGQGLAPASVAPGQLGRVSKFSSAGWAPGSRPRDLETPASQLPNICNLVLERRP